MASSTEQLPRPRHFVPRTATASALAALVAFRFVQMRRRRRMMIASAGMILFTLAVAFVPAFTPGAGVDDGRAFNFLLLLPTLLGGFLLINVIGSAASGGGRELLARDAAAVHPISATADHLGALVLAPLNIAWLVQAWSLLGITSYAIGSDRGTLIAAQVIVCVWIGLATAVAQVLAWSLEAARRIPHGVVGIRALTVALIGTALGLQLAGEFIAVLDQIPTTLVVVGMLTGFSERWLVTVATLIVLFVGAVIAGSLPANLAARRVPQDETNLETGQRTPRAMPRSPLAGLIRTDRASVWRAVPIRRGLAVLAIGPGLVAIFGGLEWNTMTILPGLVASGGALLFGVNTWCLDGRGGLWRESLPVSPSDVFIARAIVLGEFLLVGSLITIALGAVRAGVPTLGEATATLCTMIVVTVQVVGAAMRWSAAHPFAADLRSARATPAPPLSMVGYSTRLAVSTTLTGLVFSVLASLDQALISVMIAVVFLCWSGLRLMRTRAAWLDPSNRARIVTAVAV